MAQSNQNRNNNQSPRNLNMQNSRSETNLKYKIDPDYMSAQFYLNPIRSYYGAFPNFSQPIEIGALVSEKRILNLSKKETENCVQKNMKVTEANKTNTYGVKYLVLPETYPSCNFDLKVGMSEFVSHIPHQNGIDTILKWILENKQNILTTKPNVNDSKTNDTRLNADFICWRGLLTRLLSTPYERQNDWKFTVVYYKNSYYLCELETDKDINERLTCTDKLKQFTYWGHKFETYVTSDSFKGETDSNGTPDPEDNYSTVVRARLGKWSLVYAAEVDCCVNEQHNSLDNYCEIKTHRGNTIDDLDFSRNLKFMKWWLQSFLIDTKKLLIGLRDDNGIVKKLVKYDVTKICKGAQTWDSSVCFNFLEAILSFIKIFCVDENCTYVFERHTASNVINCKKLFERDAYFLRDWYTCEI